MVGVGRRLPACVKAAFARLLVSEPAALARYEGTGSVEEEVVRHRLVRVLLAVAMLVSSLTASALAQGLTGQITGTVTDAGGGVMPGATVSIKNAGTNQVREAITGADGAFQFPDLLAGTYDITVGVQGFKTYEQKGIVLGATERVALRQIYARGRPVAGDGHRHLRSVAGPDHQRRPIGAGRPHADRRHRGERSRLRQLPQAAAGRRRHQRTRGSGLGQHGRPVDQRPQRWVQLLLRRRHQQGHRFEQRQLRRARARLDRRSAGSDLELPGRVRPQLGCDRHGHHPQRIQGLPWQRGVSTSATMPGTATSSTAAGSAARA